MGIAHFEMDLARKGLALLVGVNPPPRRRRLLSSVPSFPPFPQLPLPSTTATP